MEIGSGSNPHWHQPSDLYATYSEADFRLGFDALRTTAGTVADLVEGTVVPPEVDSVTPARGRFQGGNVVTLRGGGYFFLPGLRALRFIAGQ